ncbi:MAG: tRNA pseudouridine(55) synthase TruB [Thermodesulfobacteriota bacterium]|nr:tRNA pseudouridine(55) synthase TruB [Thermodesulfobacteriota bacterium]
MGKHGVVLLDKPEGITSRKALDRAMGILRVKKAGHFGTLDPFATGLLSIGVGQGTKLLAFMKDDFKVYRATIGLERFTDTDDITGHTEESFCDCHLDLSMAGQWFNAHTGWISQVPPDYCAQKHKGTPLYRMKRANKEVHPRSKDVHIKEFRVISSGSDWIELFITCSRGTYIRSIARDLGLYLGTGGYVRRLRRIESEGFSIDDACDLDELKKRTMDGGDCVIPLAQALKIPMAHVISSAQKGIMEGRPVQIAWIMDDLHVSDGDRVSLVNEEDKLLCIVKVKRQGNIFGQIERGFVPY